MSLRGEAAGRPGRLSDPGQGIVEYGLILALAVVVCAISLLFFGDQLSALLTFIASQV
jgi:Flp pilus assembly pilin Flp